MSRPNWSKLLSTAPVSPFNGQLVRCIPYLTFVSGSPPSYLFTSRTVNRCNPKGTRCLYLAEDEDTAKVEYQSYYTQPQPKLTYYADYQAGAILDFADSATCTHFGVTNADFFGGFRLATTSTRLQQIGRAISRQTKITAMRFPSNAQHHLGQTGFNFAVFPDAIRAPDSLAILGGPTGVLESWP